MSRPARFPAPGAGLRRAFTALLGAILLTVTLAPSANAGDYTVRQCLGAGFRGFSGVDMVLGSAERVDFVAGCSGGVPGAVAVNQDRSGRTLSERVGGEYRWTAPAGAGIVATRFDLEMKNANGVIAFPVGRGSGDSFSLDGGEAHDGSRVTARWSGRGEPLGWAAVRAICMRADGCANQPSSVEAGVTLYDAEFTLADPLAPSLVPGGTIWDRAGDGAWHGGTATAALQAADTGGGVSRVWLEVNGTERNVGLVLCPGSLGSYAVSMAPCLAAVAPSQQFDTAAAPFLEGGNRIRLCAEDFISGPGSPNRTCSPERTLLTDNLAPAAPVNLRTLGGPDWRAVNGFEFAWEEPSGQVAPIEGGRYRLLDPADGTVLEERDFTAEDPGGLGPLEVPAPGEYELELRLRDAAGNLGAPARTVARFDDRPPGDVAPEPPAGWVSADELPLRQVIGRAEPRGPSGIGGYALAVSEAGPVAPCPSGICSDPQIALTGGIDDRTGLVPGLAEGSHWVSAVAASGAAVASEAPGSTLVRVDRTAPRVAIGGVPSGWSSRPVTVTAAASDSLSGMAARPGEDDGEPETVIQAEGLSPYRVPGGGASFTVTAEGASLVRFWARDLAGNSADGERGPDGSRHPAPLEAVVRIDTEPPGVTFVRERDPSDPERVVVRLEDPASGPASAGIAWRPAGSGGAFSPLPTDPVGEGRFAARMPSDDLPAGSYELRASGTDRAGNEATGDRDELGEPMLLGLPLKRQVRLRSGFGRHLRSGFRSGYGSRPLLAGRLLAGKSGLSGERLTVLETFAAGSRPARRTTRVRTDGTGRFALRLGPGPGRVVQVLYAGTRTRSRASGRRLHLSARGRVAFTVRPGRLRNGGRVTMRGRIGRAGALLPARGKLVAIQYFDPARGRWRPVELIRTGPNGSFRYRYRFRTIAFAQRIIFRAIAPAEAGWPYLHSTSRPRSVIVLPSRRAATPGSRGAR